MKAWRTGIKHYILCAVTEIPKEPIFLSCQCKNSSLAALFYSDAGITSIHHQYDLHTFNYSDLPIWDRLFGTYRDTTEFTNRCGFPEGAEQRLPAMLAFKDVYVEIRIAWSLIQKAHDLASFAAITPMPSSCRMC
ncbi:MAG: hypothetical protein R3F53_00560 [Gammaproteobacteria bacterium]